MGPENPEVKPKRVLVTGATGYIGGRLVPHLLQSGYQVRVLVRDPKRLQGRYWLDQVEVCQGDVLKAETLSSALEGISAAYYLIHSMDGRDDFHRRDLTAAENFGLAAKTAGVELIVYLGGLGDPESDLSQHLKSRQQTGERLAKGGVPVTELRAAIIVGSGSVSFEMIRYLTERIPVMVCPKWVFTRVQPIAIDDVLAYLSKVLVTPESWGQVVEIAGEDVVTYGDMMKVYAEVRGLKRLLIGVPLLTPRLSSYWVHWMTPVPASITRPLVEGLRNEVVLRDPKARVLFPEIVPLDYRTAVQKALRKLSVGEVETRWTDALVSSMGESSPVVLSSQEGMVLEQRIREVNARAGRLFGVFSSLGGERGWLFSNWAWRLRGAIDRLVGGVGLRRGRRDAVEVRLGDAVDFWRVEAVEPGRLLRLRAEMKLPGEAWIQFEAKPQGEESSQLVQTAYFAPKGLFGLLYWYILYPIHSVVYSGLSRKISELAESVSEGGIDRG